MIQKDKNLLLQDLCSRLLYGIRCSFGVDDAIYEITGINPSSCGASEIQATHIKSGINGDFTISSCKPYLFPLSSMTEEQWIDLKEYSGFKYDGCLLDLVKYTDSVSTLEFWVEEIPSNMIIRVFDWLNKNHFDYRGLIQLGLANDATGLGIY